MLFYVIGGIVTAIYLVIGVLLLIRSKNRQIISRSPILLYISHYSNLIAVLLILPIATALQDPDDKYEFFSTS